MDGKSIKGVLNHTLDEWEDRDYLGMSAISKCMRFLYDGLVNGRAVPSLKSQRYCHEGYLHEHDVINRLLEKGVRVVNCGHELIAPFDARFKGHIDGEIAADPILVEGRLVEVAGDLIEIKSVNDERFARAMDDGPFPEHVDQVQCYMRFGGYRHAILIYKSRDTGDIWTEDVALDEQRGALLEEKAGAILAMVDRRERPRCTCGYCR